MISFRNQGPQIATDNIAEVEAAIGSELPPAYRTFLLTENGGSPTPNIANIDGLPSSPTDIQVFFGIDRSIATSNLSWNIDLMRERAPKHRLLPVACDSGGNVFCLDLFREFTGGVIYCDLSGPHIAFYEVAPNFESFLEKIRRFE